MISESGVHILIVDNDAGLLTVAAEIARIEGLQADTATSLDAARSKLRAGGFDLVLLNPELPDGNGMALLDELDPANHVPVVIITDNPSAEWIVRSVRAPVVDYMIKPLDQGALRTLIGNATNARRPAQILFHVGMTIEEVERQMLLKTLAHFNNHKPKTAQALGISLKTVYNRLARFDYTDNANQLYASKTTAACG